MSSMSEDRSWMYDRTSVGGRVSRGFVKELRRFIALALTQPASVRGFHKVSLHIRKLQEQAIYGSGKSI